VKTIASTINLRQKSLFSWEEVEPLGDLQRLVLAIENLPDEKLMRKLEKQRGNGRNDYPVRAMWNSLVAMVVFEHPSVESLRRELSRNGQMRWLCGFTGSEVPSSSAYSRFVRKLAENHHLVREVFEDLADQLSEELEGFGQQLAIDGKAVHSHAAGPPAEGAEQDGRRDTDADYGVKTYHLSDGTKRRKYWFGYQLSLVADTTYELPVAYSVTKASRSEVKEAERLVKDKPGIFDRCEVLVADRGYDSGPFIDTLWTEHRAKAVIDIRNIWNDGEDTRLLGDWPNVVYNYRGEVFCHCPETNVQREMAYGGFEKDRQTLKYRCPAWQYEGVDCAGSGDCPVRSSLRIPLSEDRRIFTPVARSSYRWDDLYQKRTAVERLNSRLHVSFGFERHYVRGLQKMKVKAGLALSVMLAMAVGSIRQNRLDQMRSLVQSA